MAAIACRDQAPAPLTVVDIAVHDQLSCATLSDRTVRCWGWNPLTGQAAPVPYELPLADVPAKASGAVGWLAVGRRHACARRRDGTVWCRGDNRMGQLGDGTLVDRDEPVLVRGLVEPRPWPPRAATEVGESAVGQQRPSSLPAGCTHEPTLTVAGRTMPVVSSYARYGFDDRIDIVLADHRVDPANLFAPVRGGQRKLHLLAFSEDRPRLRHYRGHVREHDGVDALWPEDGDTVTLTHSSEQWVCGAVTWGDPLPLRAHFAAAVVSSAD